MQLFEFQSVLFNFHDVILLMTALQCLFFSILLCSTKLVDENEVLQSDVFKGEEKQTSDVLANLLSKLQSVEEIN